eukprot:4803523-Prymnesium_polylepis.1
MIGSRSRLHASSSSSVSDWSSSIAFNFWQLVADLIFQQFVHEVRQRTKVLGNLIAVLLSRAPANR